MRVMSFNIQHGLAYLEQKINLNLFASTIKENMVDVCGLNEVRNTGADCEYTDQTGAIAEKLGYNSYFGQAISIDNKNPYGNAVVSRYPFIKTSTTLIPDPEKRDEPVYYETRCVIHAVVNINNVPNISDIDSLEEILLTLNAKITRDEEGIVIDSHDIINAKMDKTELKYPVDKSKGVSTKYTKLG